MTNVIERYCEECEKETTQVIDNDEIICEVCDCVAINHDECQHDNYEMVGKFPENMYVDDEYLCNKVKCSDCGEIGEELYQFTERVWSDTQ